MTMTDSPTHLPTVTSLESLAKRAHHAARSLALVSEEQRNAAIYTIADALEANAPAILAANDVDLADARATGTSPALLDRLALDGPRIAAIAADARSVAALPDPLGEDLQDSVLDNGLRLIRRRIPIGVLGIIYEARPNVTVDVGVLCLKSGNAALLRGGKETLRSNRAISEVMAQAIAQEGISEDSITFVDDPDRDSVRQMLLLDQYIDMIVPRGGSGLHEFCKANSRIPVLTGGIGICHIYVDESADMAKSIEVIHNAKTQRPSVCNSLDTLLVHAGIAKTLLPALAARMAESAVSFRLDPASNAILNDADLGATAVLAGADDFDQEWLDLILGVKVVEDLDEALDHIHDHSTRHSDAILTNNSHHADRFIREVDSAAVYVNASTRFTDGSQFGLGAEVAVSTQKLHARGPVGLTELTTYKWIGLGDYLVRP